MLFRFRSTINELTFVWSEIMGLNRHPAAQIGYPERRERHYRLSSGFWL